VLVLGGGRFTLGWFIKASSSLIGGPGERFPPVNLFDGFVVWNRQHSASCRWISQPLDSVRKHRLGVIDPELDGRGKDAAPHWRRCGAVLNSRRRFARPQS